MGAFDLIAKAAKGVKNAPFFSKADVVLDELQRGKGTGDEFLTELVKKGVKPTELKDRGLDKALKGKPKMTKAEVQKVFEQKAPPKVQEKVLSDASPDYEDFLEAKAQEEYGVDWFDLNKQEKAEIEKMFNELPTTQYEQYKTPGGENYREILLKLPSRGLTNHERWELDLFNRDAKKVGEFTPEKQARYEELKAKEGDPNYVSGHYKNDPNLLAHIRVQDFKTPEGKKVLLVDEIQSDWHQEGRKKGYKQELSEEEKNRLSEVVFNAPNWASNPDMLADFNRLNAKAKAAERGVPDAPFKKNWHELAMKRVLDYAAENGYDSIAITPGAEQAKRYDLSKQVSEISVGLMGDQRMVKIKDSSGKTIDSLMVGPDGMVSESDIGVAGKALDDVVGKELASKITSLNEPQVLRGIDLQVGGEGMKGFYDKIMPDYLNNYGKKYGAQTGQIQLQTGQEMGRGATGSDMIPSYSPTMQSFHSFDITPQMREEITTKGQPMYGKVAMPALEGLAAGTGAATIGSEVFDTNNEQQVQNPVHFTENPDAMLLELMQRN